MATPLTEEEITAFVGQNADHYFSRWTPLIQGQNWTSFNWAAFFLTGVWLLYRKMYKPALIFFGIIILESILEWSVFGDETPRGLERLVGLTAAIVCGAYGNRWYLAHATKVIVQVRAQDLPGNAFMDAISKRGGTSVGAALGFFAAVALIFLACFVLKLCSHGQ
ncbi:MAG: DUF2628 domain-containing protein [Verrucomicrobiota bacterium]